MAKRFAFAGTMPPLGSKSEHRIRFILSAIFVPDVPIVAVVVVAVQ